MDKVKSSVYLVLPDTNFLSVTKMICFGRDFATSVKLLIYSLLPDILIPLKGMDFTTMRTLFQGMSRMDLKKKFIKEQRADLNFVNQVLKERKPVPTAEELQKLSGKVFREPKEVYAELKKDEAELMETQRRQEEADGEANKARERQVEEEGVRLGVEIAAKPPDQSGDEESGDEEILKEVSPTKEQDLENEANPVKSIEDTVDHADDTAKHTDGVSNDPESDNEADDENEVQEVQDDETDYGDEVE